MECAICYNRTSDVSERDTFVTLPCVATQHLNQRHALCFQCFIVNHATSGGKCPVCRDNYMDYVRETHDVPVPESNYVPAEIISFADNLSSPIQIADDVPEDQLIIIEEPDEMPIVNDYSRDIIPNNPDIDEIGETFEEFARYVLANCEYEPRNQCIVCGIDMGEDNPRQYCEKTYCPEM
jgi:hypothetical protein